MTYDNEIIKATFLSRPNRFIAYCDIDGTEEKVHVKNTGRCKELLIPKCNIYLAKSDNPNRSTKYDLIAVEKQLPDGNTLLINMDSQIPNGVVAQWLPQSGLFSDNAVIRREVFYGSSRFDIMVEDTKKISYIEVKGVTLERDGVALFPDAPTLRGVKHIRELIQCAKEGLGAYIVFVIQMKGIKSFSPNDEMHPEFGDALREAKKSGVKIIAMDCDVTTNSITIRKEVPILL